MASIVMHLCISRKIQQMCKFSNQFLVGGIMPDIKNKLGNDRIQTHYLDNNSAKSINIIKYYNENIEDIKNSDEIKLGYISHLIQDKIWFTKYCDSDSMTYEEYCEKVYKSYSIIDKLLLNLDGYDIEELRNILFNEINDDKVKEIVNKYTRILEPSTNKILFEITYNDIEDFQNECIEEFMKCIER